MSTSDVFKIARVDGRSNAQVIIDCVKDGEPGRVYGYDELAAALSVGTDRTYGIESVRASVIAACPRLLRESQRTLYNVRRVGYRLSHATDHNRLGLQRTRRADVQMRRGVQILQHVRWDEMDENSRKIHEGTLMVVGAFYQQQQAMERRLSAVETAIKNLRS